MTEAQARTTIDNRIREALRDGASPETAAQQCVSGASRDELEQIIATWALHRAKWLARRLVVAAERTVEAGGATFAAAVASGNPVARGAVVYVPGDGMVSWDAMTADQHDARAQMQRRLAGECVQDAERHEEAARMIREAEVTCLADIGPAKLASAPKPRARARTSRRRQAIAA